MSTQLRLNFMPHPTADPEFTFDPQSWLDVSAIAAGIGFEQPVFISLALSDALEANQGETESDYDQRLYDALWYAHFEWSHNNERPVNFTFTFLRKHLKTENNHETSLRLRGEDRSSGMFLRLREDFQEVTVPYFPD
jgi:hypothetical protein